MARPKGSPNKATHNAREAIAKLVEGNVDRLEGWLDAIAADERHGPLMAYRCFMDVVEYHIPKLARTESTISGPDGGPIENKWTVEMVRPK